MRYCTLVESEDSNATTLSIPPTATKMVSADSNQGAKREFDLYHKDHPYTTMLWHSSVHAHFTCANDLGEKREPDALHDCIDAVDQSYKWGDPSIVHQFWHGMQRFFEGLKRTHTSETRKSAHAQPCTQCVLLPPLPIALLDRPVPPPTLFCWSRLLE